MGEISDSSFRSKYLTVLGITMPKETVLILDGFSRNNINSNYSY